MGPEPPFELGKRHDGGWFGAVGGGGARRRRGLGLVGWLLDDDVGGVIAIDRSAAQLGVCHSPCLCDCVCVVGWMRCVNQ